MKFNTSSFLLSFLIRFIVCFLVCYYGTLAMIGVTSPGGNIYLSFVDKYLNYIDLLRTALLNGAKFLCSLFGYSTRIENIHSLVLIGGRGVHIVYSCIGYGIMSFWIAFVVADKNTLSRKFIWIIAGLITIYIINIIRISILLIGINEKWPLPLGWEHHTWFNIVAYLCIFILMFFYDRSQKKISESDDKENV